MIRIFQRYFLKIPKGIKFQFGAFLLIYSLELVFRLLFVFVSFKLNSVPCVLYHSTLYGFPLDISITGYLMICLNLLFVIGNLGLSPKIKWSWLKWMFEKTFIWVISLISILHFIILFADILLFHYWQWRINSQAISYIFHWQIILRTLPSIVLLSIILLIGVILLVVFKRLRFFYKVLDQSISHFSFYYLFLLPLYFLIARGGVSSTPVNLGSVLKEGSLPIKVSSINGMWNAFYSISNLNSMYSLNSLLVDEKIEDDVYNRYNPDNNQSGTMISAQVKAFWLNDAESKPNVHLIILEGINQHWLERENSPLIQLKKLSANFLNFTRCYAVGDRTDKGLASLIGGWPGEPGSGILFSPERWRNLVGLADILKSSNYSSEFWYGGDDDFANNGAFLKSMGFDYLYDVDFIDKNYSNNESGNDKLANARNLRKIKWGYSDISTAAVIINANQKEHFTRFPQVPNLNPVFRTWLTLSTHEPFDIVGNYYFKSEKQLFVSSMKHLDSAVYNYVNSILNNKNEWDNSLIIIVSDHGKVFGLDDVPWSESEFFRIPLLIGGGALRKDLRGKNWNSIVSQSDLYVTLSYMLTDNYLALQQTWGRPMFNFNDFNQTMCFKGDYSLFIEKEKENLGHIEESVNLLDSMELRRRALQSKIIRKYFRF